MGLPCAHEIHWCIYEKKPIPIECIHWHWRFDRDPDWDSRKNNGVESNADSLSQRSSLPGTPPQQNSASPENPPSPENFLSPENLSSTTSSLPEVPRSPTNVASTKNPSSTGNAMLLGNSYLAHLPPLVNLQLPLDPHLQKIEEPLVIKPRSRPSGSLNKKQSRKNDYFERSTRREPSRFEHVERDFSSSQRGTRRTGIRGNAVRRGQHRPQNQPGNRPQNQPQNRSQSRTNQSTSGNVAGIPTEMTSVFSI